LKTKATIIFVIFVLIVLVGTIFFIPKIFPKNQNESKNSTSVQTSKITEVTSVLQKTYTVSEIISESDNVIVGTVIKADVDEDGVLYTITVSWKDVYKGRNYATMGYAYVKGAKSLEMNKDYLFICDNIGDTKEEKYHYKEPFENAPWVFAVNADKTLTHVSNGSTEFVTDIGGITLDKIDSICKSLNSSK